MLSPRYLEGLSDELADIYAQLELDIITDIARRVARMGKISEASVWQAQILAESGALKKDISRYLKKYDPQIRKEITAIYNDAMVKNARADNKVFNDMLNGRTVSDVNAQIMLASIQKTYSDLSRLTITTAAESERAFIQQANNVYMQTVTGAFDYNTAMKNACDNLANKGVTAVQYNNGKPVRRSIEAAVRMNILTGINQTAANMSLNNCEELGVDLVETTAHIGARPEHEAWQGEIFSLSGNDKRYRPFSVCELGSATGICGINCRHSFYPYFEGLDPHYSAEDLDEMSRETVTYNGATMSRYEGEQYLRHTERTIRKYKREAATLEAAGQDATAARTKLGQWQARARDFTEQTKIHRDYNREFVGTIQGKQPRGILAPTPALKAPLNENIISGVRPAQIIYKSKTEKETQQLIDTLFNNGETSTLKKELISQNIIKKPVRALKKPLTEGQIIQRVADLDRGAMNPSNGSVIGRCISQLYAYLANKSGFNVLDLRNDASSEFFSQRINLSRMARLKGVKSKTYLLNNDIKAFNLLTKEIETGKEYILGIGNHGAIVRKNKNNILEYLELQSYKKRGWHELTESKAIERFLLEVDKTRASIIIDAGSLMYNKEFIEIIEYLNTLDY